MYVVLRVVSFDISLLLFVLSGVLRASRQEGRERGIQHREGDPAEEDGAHADREGEAGAPAGQCQEGEGAPGAGGGGKIEQSLLLHCHCRSNVLLSLSLCPPSLPSRPLSFSTSVVRCSVPRRRPPTAGSWRGSWSPHHPRPRRRGPAAASTISITRLGAPSLSSSSTASPPVAAGGGTPETRL